MLPAPQTTGYAVRALRCLQEPGGHPVLVEETAGDTGIPVYLSKLIHKLAKQGLVVARGHHGGVVLARPSTEITLGTSRWPSTAPPGGRCLMGLLGVPTTPLRSPQSGTPTPGPDHGPAALGDPRRPGAEPRPGRGAFLATHGLMNEPPLVA